MMERRRVPLLLLLLLCGIIGIMSWREKMNGVATDGGKG